MKLTALLPVFVLFLSLLFVQSGAGQDNKPGAPAEETISIRVPLGEDLFSIIPVASIDGELITVKDLRDSLGTVHSGATVEAAGNRKRDYGDLLRRLIATRLILREAQTMGLDELPEVKALIETYNRNALIELLQEEVTKGVKADEAEAAKRYAERVKTWKTTSVAFELEEEARKAEAAVRSGRDFGEVAAEAVARGVGKGDKQGMSAKPKELLPPVSEALSRMEPGSVSPVIRVESEGKAPLFVLVRLEEVLYPDDQTVRQQVHDEVLNQKKVGALTDFNKALSKKYLKMKGKVFEKLDYNVADSAIEKLRKDTRVLATIKGDRPITVAEFTDALAKKFFHGMDQAAKSRKITLSKKITVLEEMLGRRLFRLEAMKRGIDKRPEYLRKVREYRESVLFGVFLQKVVAPDIRLGDEELRQYYEAHAEDYSYPSMIRLDGIAFVKRDDAVGVFERLKRGEDFRWLRENAEGQADRGAPGLMTFSEGPVLISEMAEGLQSALSNVQTGDVRLYTAPEGHHYILLAHEVFPPARQRFEEVRGDIAKKVFSIKMKAAIDEWGGRLREHADVRVYLEQ